MARYHGRMTPKQVIKAIESFVTEINATTDPDLKVHLFNAAHTFAIAEARRNDKFPHVVFMERISERTGVNYA